MRRAHRLDSNHKDVVDVLERAGCRVLSLAGLGNGVPDVLVRKGTWMALVEIKDGNKPPSKQRLTPDEVDFHANWPVTTVISPADALDKLGLCDVNA